MTQRQRVKKKKSWECGASLTECGEERFTGGDRLCDLSPLSPLPPDLLI